MFLKNLSCFAGCKGKSSFYFWQTFFEKILNFFSLLFAVNIFNELPCFAVGKGKSSFHFLQTFF